LGFLPDLLANGSPAGGLVAIGASALILPFAVTGWPALMVVWSAPVVMTHIRARRHCIL
jgi:hypothetical protein